jgi:predicted nucleic acid-binding protein
MADDPTKRAPQDPRRINLSQEHEIRYWTKALSVTEERLRELVRDHGNSADKIRDAIKAEVARAESED